MEKKLITLKNLPMVHLPAATLSKGAGADLKGYKNGPRGGYG